MAATNIRLQLTLPETDHHRLLDSIAVLDSFVSAHEPPDMQEDLWRMLKESVGSESGSDWFPQDRMSALDLYEQLCALAPHLPFIRNCLLLLQRD